MTFHIQLPIWRLIMKVALCKLSIASKASLLQDGAEPGPSAYPIFRRGELPLCSAPYQMSHCYKSSSVRTLGHIGSPLGSTQQKSKGVHSLNQCYCYYHTWWSLLESCYFSSLHQYVPNKGQGPNVSSNVQISGSYHSTECLGQQLASSLHLYRSLGHCQWADCLFWPSQTISIWGCLT